MAPRNIVIGQKVTAEKIQRAKELREHMTEADFYCHAAALVIELDGAIHKREQGYDEERTRLLADYGIDVIRFKNETVLNNLPHVLGEIDRICRERATRVPNSRRKSNS